MYVALCRRDILCRIFILYICHEYLCCIFWMRILAKYMYKYHIHNNTWKHSRKYFMLMGKGACADALVGNRITCLECVYEMISMSMPAYSRVCYADVEMRRCKKGKATQLLAPSYMIYVLMLACQQVCYAEVEMR